MIELDLYHAIVKQIVSQLSNRFRRRYTKFKLEFYCDLARVVISYKNDRVLIRFKLAVTPYGLTPAENSPPYHYSYRVPAE